MELHVFLFFYTQHALTDVETKESEKMIGFIVFFFLSFPFFLLLLLLYFLFGPEDDNDDIGWWCDWCVCVCTTSYNCTASYILSLQQKPTIERERERGDNKHSVLGKRTSS